MFDAKMSFVYLFCIYCVVIASSNAAAATARAWQESTDGPPARPSFDQLCREPSFDAVVAISDDHLILFKNNFVWLLNLVSNQVGFPFYLQKVLRDCPADAHGPRLARPAPPSNTIVPHIDSVPKSLLQRDYYVWNPHDNLTQYFDQICVNMNDHVCHYQIDLVPRQDAYHHQPSTWVESNRALFHNYSLRIRRNVKPENEMCRKDLTNNAIETALTKEFAFTEKRTHRVWLFGQHFSALLTFQPNQYDPHQVIFRSEVIKLYRIIRDADGSSQQNMHFNVRMNGGQLVRMSPAKEDRILEDVYSFAILPRGQVFVFFERTHCVLNFYSLDCDPRMTAFLIGCTMPEREFGNDQVLIEDDDHDDEPSKGKQKKEVLTVTSNQTLPDDRVTTTVATVMDTTEPDEANEDEFVMEGKEDKDDAMTTSSIIETPDTSTPSIDYLFTTTIDVDNSSSFAQDIDSRTTEVVVVVVTDNYTLPTTTTTITTATTTLTTTAELATTVAARQEETKEEEEESTSTILPSMEASNNNNNNNSTSSSTSILTPPPEVMQPDSSFGIDFFERKRNTRKRSSGVECDSTVLSLSGFIYYLHLGLQVHLELLMRAAIIFLGTMFLVHSVFWLAALPFFYFRPQLSKIFFYIFYKQFIATIYQC